MVESLRAQPNIFWATKGTHIDSEVGHLYESLKLYKRSSYICQFVQKDFYQGMQECAQICYMLYIQSKKIKKPFILRALKKVNQVHLHSHLQNT